MYIVGLYTGRLMSLVVISISCDMLSDLLPILYASMISSLQATFNTAHDINCLMV